MEKLKRIRIGNKFYPFKIDLNVLEAMQEEFGTVNEFERQLRGMHYQKDEDGHYIKNEDGNSMMYITEPSIKAIKAVLPAAIKEGLAIEAEWENREMQPVDEEQIIRDCTISFTVLGRMLLEEFKRCFETKK